MVVVLHIVIDGENNTWISMSIVTHERWHIQRVEDIESLEGQVLVALNFKYQCMDGKYIRDEYKEESDYIVDFAPDIPPLSVIKDIDDNSHRSHEE